MIATERLSGETSTIGMKSPFGRSLGKNLVVNLLHGLSIGWLG